MESKIKFSIIIPTFNRKDFIFNTLQTVFCQTYSDFEVLLIDDGSTDGTEMMAKSVDDSRFKYVKKVNGERGAARNTGIQMARGKYVTFLDSDDIIYPDYLEAAQEFIEKNNSPVFFRFPYDIKTRDGKVIKHGAAVKGDLNTKIIYGNFLSCLGVFVLAEVARKYPFNEDRDLAGSEDWELWVRLSASYPLLEGQKVTGSLIQHPSRSMVTMSKEKLVKRIALLKRYLFQDQQVQEKYGIFKKRIYSDLDTYIALHLACSPGNALSALKYLKSSLVRYPKVVLHKRFYVVIKKLIYK